MLEQGIVSRLNDDFDIQGLIQQRIYPVVLPETATYPCLSYQMISAVPDYALDGREVKQKRIQFDSWGETYADVKNIAAALAASLDGFTGMLADGTRVLSCFPSVSTDFFEQYSRVYRVMSEYVIQFV